MIAVFLAVVLSAEAVLGGPLNGKQYFTEKPDPVNNVIAGGQILLRCKVGNLGGKVQWTRNGFALGYQPDLIKNYCGQCSLAGDAVQGEYHLLVQNIRKDATYECQVSPDARSNHKGLRAIAEIKVLIPPSSLEIDPQVSVDMRAGLPQKLSCTAKGSFPKAKIVWYHRGNKIFDQEYEERVTAGEIEGTWDTENIIIFNATNKDNDTTLSCVVEHKAIKNNPLKRDIRLNVFYPPDEPQILGDIVGEWRVGDSINITCHVDTGNPPPQVFWYKNNKPLKHFFWRRIANGSTVVDLVGKVTQEDRGNMYTCKAWNDQQSAIVISSKPVKLNVTYGAENLVISGPQRAHSGSKLEFSCRTDKSNPPTSIRWSVNGKHHSGLQTSIKAVDGAWETESKINVQTDSSEPKLKVECSAYHPTLGKTTNKIHPVHIIRPPMKPQITKTPDRIFKEGEEVTLICSSHHGDPFPRLVWYKQGIKLKQQKFKMITGSHSEAVLQIKVDRSDNQINYVCQATTEGHSHPANQNTNITVLFPPNSASIYMTPRGGGPNMSIIRSGDSAEIHCDVSSSNPEPRMRWFKEGKEISQTSSRVVRKKISQHGGVSVSSILSVNGRKAVTAEEDRKRFSCVVENPKINGYNITKIFTMSVRYKPNFDDTVLDTYSVVEGRSKKFTLEASANPSNIEYNWLNQSSSAISLRESSISVSKITREDVGFYVLVAKNSIGKTKKMIYLDVFFPPRILKLTEQVQKNEGESVTFICKIEANPMTNKTVSWGRVQEEHFNFSRAQFSHDGKGTFSMTINNIRKSDRGKFFCAADNKLGEAIAKRETGLLVNFKPEIRKFPRQSKFAAELEQKVEIKCVAYGFPDVKMHWKKNGTMNLHTHSKTQLDYATWESTLSIESASPSDFGDYKCISENELGEDSHTISLVQPGKPDPPHNLVVTRHNYKTIRLQWSAGFNGGSPQKFMTKVRELSTGTIVLEKILKYSNMEPSDEYVSQHIEEGLKPGVQYGFSVQAITQRGKSKYCTEKIKSLEVVAMNARIKNAGGDVMVFGLGGTTLVLFVIISLIVAIVCKKQKKGRRDKDKKRERSQSVSTSSRRSITIERYPPSKPYTNALGGDMFISPTLDRNQSIFSDTSDTDYKHYLGRSMSIPHDSGYPSYAGSCEIPTVIAPLNRQVSSGIGSNGMDTTLDDDVFDDSVSKDGEPKYNRLHSPSFQITADMMLKGGRGRSGSVTSPYAYFSPPRLGVSGLQPNQMTRSYGRHYSTSSNQQDKHPIKQTSATLSRIHSQKYISMVTPDNKKTPNEIQEEISKRMSELNKTRDMEPHDSLAHLQLPSLPELPKSPPYSSDLPKLPGYTPDLPDLPAFSADLPKNPGYSSERIGYCSEMSGYHPELSLPGYAPKNRNVILSQS